MKLFRKSKTLPDVASTVSGRTNSSDFFSGVNSYENQLYENLRINVPIIDACINKIIRLTGNYTLKASDERYQNELDNFVNNVKVGAWGQSLYTFTDSFLDSLLTYGNAVGEMLIDKDTFNLVGLYNADSTNITVKAGKNPIDRQFYIGRGDDIVKIQNPQNLLYCCLNANAKNPNGISILRGLPSISNILTTIYKCIGQNFDRIGNARYAVTYKPSVESGDRTFAKERAEQIATEWADGMNASKDGEIKDFVAVGDIDIKVIGAENQIMDTQVPVRQLLEEIVAKLSIPPFLLGLNWSSTERMSKQQADMLTSELEFYRRLLNPVILKIANTFLRLLGTDTVAEIEWENINLQDECELAEARLNNAKAKQIELTFKD